MSSVLRSVRKRKKGRTLRTVDVIDRADYAELDVDAKVELICSLVPLGLMHVEELLDAEVTALAGERYARKDASVGGRRHGSNPGTVGLAGQRVPIRVPRLPMSRGARFRCGRTRRCMGERAVNDLLLKRVLYGISCRNYEAGDEAAMRLLVSAGADPLLPNDQKTTALVVAAGVGVRGYSPVRERDALEAVKLCLELGHDVNAVNTSGDTALHGAAYRGLTGSDTIIQLLLSKGAELNAKNNYGWTPLAIAEGIYFGGSDSRSDKTAELFRKMGAEPTPADIERGGNVARERERARKAQESK